jgi:hypothetical protein
MKRWVLVVVWFVLLFVWNFATKLSFAEAHLLTERILVAFEYMLAPIEIIASILAVVAIYKISWKKRPLT